VHYVRSNGTNMPERLKVRAPSFVNIPSFKASCLGAPMADVMITLAACDPCYSCTERSLVLARPGDAPRLASPGLIEASRQKTFAIARSMGRAPDLDLE
jgi:NADH-quinone oxidoreductase subunit D